MVFAHQHRVNGWLASYYVRAWSCCERPPPTFTHPRFWPMDRTGKDPRLLIPYPHLLVLATSERFLPAWSIFRAILASESHWLQPMLVLSIHWWPAPVGVGRVLATNQ